MSLLPLLLLTNPAALAQDGGADTPPAPDLNAQLYRIPIDAERTLWTDDTNVAPDGYWRAKLGAVYAHQPLVYKDSDGVQTEILRDALQADVIGAVSFYRVRLGLDVPIWLLATSDVAAGGAGLGDVGVDLKGTLVVRDDDNPFGLALGTRFDLPTTSIDGATGSPGLAWSAQVIADLAVGDVLLAANLGTQGVPPAAIDGQTWDDQFLYRMGAGWSLADDDRAGLSFDLAGRAAYGGLGASGSPAEGLLGGWFTLGESFVVRTGVGRGISSGIGAPEFRGVLTLGYEPPKVRDRDEDGILDEDDACRNAPEDFDGWKDSDGCPDPTTRVTILVVGPRGKTIDKATVSVRTHDGVKDGNSGLEVDLHEGSWSVTVEAPRFKARTVDFSVPEGDAHTVKVDVAPTFGTVALTVTDSDGNPLDSYARVRGANTIHPAKGGKVSFEADEGEQEVIVQAEGFKPGFVPVTVPAGDTVTAEVQLQSAKAKVTKEKIEILEKVYFETGKATIKPESFGLLGDVAALIDANPDVKKVRIEGHTDNRGDDELNLTLSQERADAVKAWLVANGIAAGRLDAVGYGETKPVDERNNRKAWELNRRVEFNITEREE